MRAGKTREKPELISRNASARGSEALGFRIR
jgi:hypothetical protein